jgi:hypothetical protein
VAYSEVRYLHSDPFRFRRVEGSKTIETLGIDFGGRVSVEYRDPKAPELQIWKKHPGSTWAGRGMPARYAPAELWLVSVAEDRAKILAALHPNRSGRAAMTRLRTLLERERTVPVIRETIEPVR